MIFHRNAPHASASRYDLHLHTCWSYDATLPVEAHFKRAAEMGVRCIAISEHHNVDSVSEAEQCAERCREVRYVRAVELTVDFRGAEVDVLCYGLPSRLPEKARVALQLHHEQAQRDAARAVIAAMAHAGIPMSEALQMRLLAERRPAHVLAAQGLTLLQSSALADWLKSQGYIKTAADHASLMRSVSWPPYAAAGDLIPIFRDVGAIIVLAHPAKYFHGANERRMDELRDGLMLDGIECAHTLVPAELTPVYEAYCIRHHLLCTAGSDCHNAEDLQALFAMHGGRDEWLDPFLARLRH